MKAKSLLQSSVSHYRSEIIICRFAAQETFMLKTAVVFIFWLKTYFFRILWWTEIWKE